MPIRTVGISILTANFNQGRFLDDYFRSLINSTLIPEEIIFVDDSSTDNSLEIVGKYQKSELNIKVIPLKHNIGFTEALNVGIKYANQPIIMRLDSDDFILPIKIEKQYNFLKNNNEYNIVGTNAFYFNSFSNRVVFKTNFPTSEGFIRKNIQKGAIPILHSSIMGKTEIFQKLQYNNNTYPAEDYDFLTRLIINNYRMTNLKDYLMFYRLHENNLSFRYLEGQVNKTYKLRDYYFDRKASKLEINMRYLQVKFYRKALLSKPLKRILFLIVSAIFNPHSFARRLINTSP